MSKRLGGNVGCCLKKNQTTPRPSEHPPVMGKNCAIVKEGALVSPKGSYWTGPEKYRSTVCQSGPSKRAHWSFEPSVLII